MIALDTNVLVRYLVRDDKKQAEAARTLLESLTIEQPGFVCREVIVELVWVLERSYKCSRDQIATVLEQLATTESLVVEAGSDVIRAASSIEFHLEGLAIEKQETATQTILKYLPDKSPRLLSDPHEIKQARARHSDSRSADQAVFIAARVRMMRLSWTICKPMNNTERMRLWRTLLAWN